MRRAIALAALVASACGGRIAKEELPSEPIAFIRQEPKSGIVSLDDFMHSLSLVGTVDESGAPAEPPKRTKTTISLLTPSTRELRPVADLGVGSFPFDWSADGLYLLIGRFEGDGRSLELFSWNRMTGALDRLPVDYSIGSAAFGSGPIRLAHVGSLFRLGQPVERGIVVDLDGVGVSALPGGAGGADPDVSPDGRHVVFTRRSARAGKDPIIVLGEIGSTDTTALASGSSPRFSRDGKWIAYVTRRRGNADVWMMRSDGAAKRAIAESGYDEEFPAPSPDGRFVVYSGVRGTSEKEQSQLRLTRVADRVEIQLTQNGQNGRPVW